MGQKGWLGLLGSPIPENALGGTEFSDRDDLEASTAGPMLCLCLEREGSGGVSQVPGATCHLPLLPPG